MKEINVVKYECSCGRQFEDKKKCEDCEREHKEERELVTIGAKVPIDDGSYGGEQGQRGLTWWPNIVEGTIVSGRNDEHGNLEALVEYGDGQRKWVGAWAVKKNINRRNKSSNELFCSRGGTNYGSTDEYRGGE